MSAFEFAQFTYQRVVIGVWEYGVVVDEVGLGVSSDEITQFHDALRGSGHRDTRAAPSTTVGSVVE